LIEVERTASATRQLVSIPRRPKWDEGMSIEELAALESDAFVDWRRGLKDLERDGGLVMTPYERNLDFWRQLWRCMERSDLLVQVLDARDPDFYFCQDLYRYVSELGGGKRLLLLVNKSDYLTKEQRQQWADHFKAKDVDAIFFSALNELKKRDNMELGQPAAEKKLIHPKEREKVKKAPGKPKPQTETDAFAKIGAVASDAAPSAQNQNTRANPFLELVADQAAGLDPVEVAVPDSSDDDLDETKPAKDRDQEKQGTDDAETSEVEDSSDDEAAAPSRPLQDDAGDDDEAVADVARLLDELRARLAMVPSTEENSEKPRKAVVGFVGYPNVGKSSVINALVGATKVGMSRTPGKTKHIQTLELPEFGFTLCDAPGLVFPSVVATRAHLVINNTVSLDDLQECWGPIGLIVQKIGFAEVLRRYRCAHYVKDAAARSGDHILDHTHSFLAAFACSRNHYLRVGVPDENWAARKVLRDYVTGKLLHCEDPLSPVDPSEQNVDQLPNKKADDSDEDDEDEFGDLAELMEDDTASTVTLAKLTKRKERHMQKQLQRGVNPQADGKTVKGHHKNGGSNGRAKGVVVF